MNFIKKIVRKYIFSEKLDLNERLLNLVYFMALPTITLVSLVRIIILRLPVLVLIMVLLWAMCVVVLILTQHYKKYTLAAYVTIVGVGSILFPLTMWVTGGIDSGMSSYFVLMVTLAFLLLKGKRIVIAVVWQVFAISTSYILAAQFQDTLIIKMGLVGQYFDRVLSIVMAGLFVGCIFLFQQRIYEKERTKLVEAQELTSTLIEPAPIACMLWKDGLLFDCNEGAVKLFAVDDKRMLKEKFSELSPEYQPDGELSSERIAWQYNCAIEQGELSCEWMHNTIDGELIPCRLTLKRVAYGRESLVAVYAYDLRNLNALIEQLKLTANISKRFVGKKETADGIKTALEEIGTFLATSRVLVAAIDFEKRQTNIEYMWYKSEEFDTPVSKSAFADLLAKAFPAEMPMDGTGALMLHCNDIFTESGGIYKIADIAGIKAFILAPLYIDGHLWGCLIAENCEEARVWSESDISLMEMMTSIIANAVTRHQYELERTEAINQAHEASKAKGQFLSNMSHEIRTPMNAIIGMTNIGKNAKDDGRKNYAFEKIEEASKHLLSVINDVLDMSKIEANKLEISPIVFDFEKMLQWVVNVISFRINEKQQELALHIDKKVPRMVISDDHRITQVVMNLLSNAVKFTPEGGKITLNAGYGEETEDGCIISIEVIDSGIGISKEQQERLFSSFQQAESGTSRKFGGSGLGLAISKRIVNLMGGDIWIESELGKGAKFAFRLPVKLAEENEASLPTPGVNIKKLAETTDGVNGCLGQNQKQEEIPEDSSGIFAGRNALLAEDVEINREILMAMLEDTRLEIDCAENGRQAVEMFEATPNRYDIILMDIQMPEMDGLEATRRIRGLNAVPKAGTIPIVALTANVFSEDVEKCCEAGMNDHVGKPIDMDDIMAKLRRYLV
ncbi:hypothetical protein FACS1894111_07350 [Clostridia bacterium]|nr:hypothetical protein FACS1894111_07350 [Clostridia bacterium]